MIVHILLDVVKDQYLLIFDLFSTHYYCKRFIEDQVRITHEAIMHVDRCLYVEVFEEL